MHQVAQKPGIGYHIVGIPPDYADAQPAASFDPPSMPKLSRCGQALGEKSDPWRSQPPATFDGSPEEAEEAR